MNQPKTYLNKLFNARSIAVVGASNNPEKLGYALLDTIRRAGYTGIVYPINRKSSEIQGLRAYPSLAEVPGEIDLAIILVPAPHAASVLDQAADKGIKVAALLCAGFREAGRQDLENELERAVTERGIRILGPNIQGFSHLPNQLCAMFWPVMTMAGPISIIAQSGSVTAALAEWAIEDGIGISAAVNLGNKTDLNESDLLEYLAEDPATGAIAMHLESVKDGRRFLEAARRAARKKPVVVLKSGSSEAGKRAAASHTGALAGRDEVFAAA
ncbi:MAG: CoA-binding protein, partial [Anaerolineales bacterium]|nr:CoA-binding protein [Anaerolineales bacterium]